MKKSTAETKVMEFSAIGLDLADVNSDWVGLDLSGEIARRERVRTTESELRKVFGPIRPTTIAIEVSSHSPWISKLLSALGHTVIVANARKVALISGNRRKNNRIDAELLARLVRADQNLLFPIEHRDQAARADLVSLRTRDMLVRTRTKLINHVRGTCKGFAVKLPICSPESFVTRCSELLPTELREAFDPILEQIGSITSKIKQYDRKIDEMADAHPGARILMQIKGVGALTALAYVLTVEDPRRIVRSRSAGAYFGLVPGSSDSGETHEPKRITKEGDPFVRRLLVTAAHYILGPFGPDSDLRRHGEAIAARGGKKAKKRAVIAVARKLAVVMHRLWSRDEQYDPLYNSARTKTAA